MHRSSGAVSSADEFTLSLPAAAEYLGLSQAAFERAIEHGELTPTFQSDPPVFSVHELDTFLDNQRARAMITGRLTMHLPAQVDIPDLLRTMVTMPDERSAAEALANEVTALAGARCKATVVLRLDEATEAVRVLALSGFPEREQALGPHDPATNARSADLDSLPAPFRQAVIDLGRPFETDDPASLLEPIMGPGARALSDHLNLCGALVYALLTIGDVRWMIVLLLDRHPSEIQSGRREAIEALGVQASVALEAVRLREDVLRRATRAEALYSTVRMLARSEDFNSLLERIASLASRLLASDAGAVLIYHPDEETFTSGAAIGLAHNERDYTANLSATYLTGRAAGMTGPLQVSDASQTTTLSLPRLAGDQRTMAAICAPIIHRGSMLGAIEIYSATPRVFSDDDLSLLGTFAHQAAIALNSVHSQEVRRRALFGAVEALASANEARDGYTGEHCKRLGQLAMLIGRARGFSEEEVERIGLAAALHDIGKIAVPDAILRKPGPLTADERAIIELHPATGQEIVARVPELQDVALMIGAHQERWDGKGYPKGLAGSEIPLGARIIAVVDTYAALVEDRPYRDGASHAEAIKEMQANSGAQFDPDILGTFIEVHESVERLMAETDTLVRSGVWLSAQLPAAAEMPKGVASPGVSYLPTHRWQIHRASELVALNDIIRSIASTRDPRRMYEGLYRRLSDLIDVDAMLILLTDSTPASLRQLPEMRRASFFPVIGDPLVEGIVAQVARMKRPLWVNDYLEFARERGIELPDDEDRESPPRSAIAAPIIVDDEFLGLLTVQAVHPGAYDKRHVGIIEDIALHVGIALHNNDEYREPRARTERIHVTQSLHAQFDQLTSDDEVAHVLAQQARQSIPSDGCVVFLVQQGELVAMALDGDYTLPERHTFHAHRTPRDRGLIWTAIEEARSIVLADLTADEREIALPRRPAPGQAALIAPLLAGGEALGVVVLTRQSGPFSGQDEALLNTMARSTSTALAAVQRRSLERQRARDIAGVSRAVARVAAAPSRQAALDTIVTSLSDTFGYRLVSVYLLEGDTLVLQSQVGYATVIARIPITEGVLGRCVRSRHAILVEDVEQETDFLSAMPGVVSEVAVPLTIDGEVVGALNVESGRDRRLGEWDLAFVELYGGQAAAALGALIARERPPEPPPAAPAIAVDPITAFMPHVALRPELERAIDRAYEEGEPLALLFVDLDNFKVANDAYGHRFGDEILGWLGGFLPTTLPEHARIARYGGDAFVIAIAGAGPDAAVGVAETLRATMAATTFTTSIGHAVQLSVSVGVAAIDPASTELADADSLLHAADRAMYAAKLNGRDRVVLWTPELAASLSK